MRSRISGERLDLVQVFVEDIILRQSIHQEHLNYFPDFQKLAKKLSVGKANLQVSGISDILIMT